MDLIDDHGVVVLLDPLVDRRRPGGIDHTALRTDPLAANVVTTLRMLLSLPVDVAALVSDGLDVAGGMPGSGGKILLARLPGVIPPSIDLGPDAIWIAAGVTVEERPRYVDDAVINRTYPDRALQRLIAMRAICDRLPFSDLPQPGLGRVAAADLVQRIIVLLQEVEGHDVVAGRMIQVRNAGNFLEVLHSSGLELCGNVDRGNSRPNPGPALASNQLAGRQSFGGFTHAHRSEERRVG